MNEKQAAHLAPSGISHLPLEFQAVAALFFLSNHAANETSNLFTA